jgi:UDP-GlcNAc:undecaprenyl-phosphate GlcNAc-1-phosphate transferase
MYSILAALAVAMLVSASATPLVRRMALAIGAVDEPTARRVHTRRVPRLGGIALVAGFFAPLLVLFALRTSVGRMLFADSRLVAGFVAGALLVSALGAFDDIVGIGAKRKLAIQSIAATIAYIAGFRIDSVSLPALGTIHLGWTAAPLTILWIVGIVNALNLIDGLDGLAAGVAFFACVTNGVVAYLGGNWLTCLVAAALAGSIVGFLFHNFNPATIFMGDSGSMFLGFVLATASIFGAGSQKGSTAVAILVPILALGLPIMDTLLAMIRRFLERRPIFSPDRGHIHHRLIDLGLTHRRAVLTLYGASVVFTVGALALALGHSWEVGIALVVLTVTLVGLVRFVGYFNYSMLRRSQRERQHEPSVQHLRKALPHALARLDAARGPEEIQSLLERVAADARLLAVELDPLQAGSGFSGWRWEAPETAEKVVRDAVSAKFPVIDALGGKYELKFHWDSDRGDVSPQAEILLQLIADGTERLLQRPARAREASRSGRLRPVS